jgi:Dolichyl-phosphate-mannose-protein mannosyltransferase
LLTALLARRESLAIFLLVWIFAAAYLGLNLNRGWVPHDEGILGQSAERILHGELPHRDFEEPYTGGLAYLDAAAFRLFGANLMVLRWLLFSFFLVWVAAVFAIAREFCSAWPAAGVTALTVVWSVPNYPAAMPSWYCLFLATFGVLALLRHLRSPHPGFLVLAGLSGGLSFLVKTPGLYYVAGVLLFLVFCEQSLADDDQTASDKNKHGSTAYSCFVAVSLALFLGFLARLVLPESDGSELVHFFLPSTALSCLLVARERGSSAAGSWIRFQRFFALALPFLAGAALPALLWFVFYWRSGALQPLLAGLFVHQLRRIADARLAPPHWAFEFLAIPIALFLAQRRRSPRFLVAAAVLQTLAALALLLASRDYVLAFLVTLDSVRALVPLLTLAVSLLLYYRRKNPGSGIEDRQLMLLVSMLALTSLIQFPYAGPLYFCYFAAFFFLTLSALLSLLPGSRRLNLAVAGGFFALFAIFLFRPASIAAFEFNRLPAFPHAPLDLPRAGNLRVFDDQAALYQSLIPFVVNQSAGRSLLAAPDCPQIYFLSGLRNPTPFFFDFFAESADYKTYIEGLLDRPNFIKVIVINDHPAFSRPHHDILRTLVAARFPHSRKFPPFEVFWR